MNVRPSYQSGFARCAAESERPEDWNGLVESVVQNLGNTGQIYPDISRRNSYGVGVNAPTWESRANTLGVRFNGLSQYIDCGGGAALNLTGSISVETLVYRDVGWYATPVIVAKRMTNPNVGYCWEIATSSGGLLWRVNANTNVASGGVMTGNKWYHIVCTYDRMNLLIYLNGMQVASAGYTAAITASSAVPMTIGKRSHVGAEEWFNGMCALCNVYGRALSEAEAKTKSADPLAMFRLIQPSYGGGGIKPIYAIRRRQLQGAA